MLIIINILCNWIHLKHKRISILHQQTPLVAHWQGRPFFVAVGIQVVVVHRVQIVAFPGGVAERKQKISFHGGKRLMFLFAAFWSSP